MLTFISVPYAPARPPAALPPYRQADALCRHTLASAHSAFLSHRPLRPLRAGRLRSVSRRARVATVPTALLSGGGILGVGPAEIAVIAAVGWFILGPEKLYALSKDIGKLIGDLRRTANEARDSFTEALEFELDDDSAQATKTATDTPATDEVLDPSAAILQSTLKEGHTKVVIDESPAGKGDDDVKEDVKDDVKDDVNDDVNNDDLPAAIQTTQAAGLPGDTEISSTDGADDDEEMSPHSSVFLDQLKRVSDPNQVPPSDVPTTLDVNLEMDEQEVERLQKEYMEARARLDARRSAHTVNGDGLKGHVGVNEESAANGMLPSTTSLNELTEQPSSKRTDGTP